MDPIAFHIGPRPIYWYGICVALGFLAGVMHWSWLAKREGRPAGIASDLLLWIMASAIVGARVAYVLANWPQFAAEPWSIIRIDQGGLVFYGGLLGASAGVIAFSRIRKEPLWRLADFVVTALPLGHAFGRVGCFTRGCCYGTEHQGVFSVFAENAFRHPVQLYEALANILIYVVLVVFHVRRRADGQTLAVYLSLYGAARFGLEFLRGDVRLHSAGLTVAQWMSVILIALSIALFAWRRSVSESSQSDA